ncbi:MAG: threonine aldolase family protein [Tumebacillaceae bacterium]
MIDLRSDTITKPTDQMRKVIYEAEVGDSAYFEDRSVQELEEYCADFFQKESAIFMPSGTMSNQIALRCHTGTGDEVILENTYHINYYESAQTIDLAKVALNACLTSDGVLTPAHVQMLIDSKYRSPVYSIPKLVCVENTISGHGGRAYPIESLQELYHYTKQQGMALHQDGARLLNASVASGVAPHTYAAACDTLSFCFSKGLGAPIGSILIGDQAVINDAKKFRKWYGGTMHQAGFMAAAALYAMQHHVDRLEEDHENAKLLAHLLMDAPGVQIDLDRVETNMVFLDISGSGMSAFEFVEISKKAGVHLFAFSSTIVRVTTHLDVNEEDIRKAAEIMYDLFRRIERNEMNVVYG